MPSIAHLIHAYGLLVAAGVIGLENVGIPFAGETALIIASVIAGTMHDLNIASVIPTAARSFSSLSSCQFCAPWLGSLPEPIACPGRNSC